MENLLFLGVPILKHIRVWQICKSVLGKSATECFVFFLSLSQNSPKKSVSILEDGSGFLGLFQKRGKKGGSYN